MRATKPIRLLATTLLLCLLIPAGAPTAFAKGEEPKDAKTIGKALKKGKFKVGLRYRFETVSDDAPAVAAKDANASTLRSTLSYRSARYRGLSVFGEFEDVRDIGFADEHNNLGAGNLANNVTDRPVIADVENTELQQAYVQYERKETSVAAGRMEIGLGNLRFVGPVGWRQNHQSFDALRVRQSSIPRTKLTYAYLHNVNRIFGDNKELHGHLLDAEVTVGDAGKLTPYVYLLDYDSPADAGLSTTTYGARWQNKAKAGEKWTIPYLVEIAEQQDAGDNPADVDAGYRRIEIGAAHKRINFKVGMELLEGSVADGQFMTPLATLHKFNGWADKFLNTPTNGLQDLYAGVGGECHGVAWVATYHRFESDSLNIDYGSEIDAQAVYTAPWNQLFGVKAAIYDADMFAADTEKFMFWTGYGF